MKRSLNVLRMVAAWTALLWAPWAGATRLELAAPADGAQFEEGESIVLTASAPFLKGRSARVEFFADQQSLGVVSHRPFELVWFGATPGEYALTVQVSLGPGHPIVSPPVMIRVAGAGRSRLIAGAAALASFVIDSVGTAQSWGNNVYGQLGIGAAPGHVASAAPVLLPAGVRSWRSIAAGGDFTLLLSADGQLYACGLNQLGALGQGTTDLDSHAIPLPVPRPTGVNRWTAIAAGVYHSVAIDDRGQVYAWGPNDYGQLGQGQSGSELGLSPAPVRLPTTLRWTALAAGYAHTLALSGDGQIYSWGYCDSGQLGRGSFENQATPGPVPPPSLVKRWVSIAAGYQRSMALGDDGQIYTWGNNSFGQLGTGAFEPAASAVPIPMALPPGVDGWTSISSGAEHCFALARNGTLYAWGRNDRGQLADNTPIRANPWGIALPQVVPLPSGTLRWIAAAAGNSHTVLATEDCRLFTCGFNEFGQLGHGDFGDTGALAPINVGICDR